MDKLANMVNRVADLVAESAVDPLDEREQFTADVARELLRMKRALGITGMRQNYKGTGSQRFRRQLWTRFADVGPIDIWLDRESFQIGGVLPGGLSGSFKYGEGDAKQAAARIAEVLQEWKKSKAGVTASLRSRRAMYWYSPGRVYRMTRTEMEKGSAVCSKCGGNMKIQPFTKTDKLWVCSKCGFKVQRSKVIGDGIEVDVTIKKAHSRRGRLSNQITAIEELPAVADDRLSRLSGMKLNEIASLIYDDHRAQGKKVNYAAKPYLEALSGMREITDSYGFDPGSSIVAYLLGNLSSWKGDVAKAVKKELNKRLKSGH